MGPNGAVDPSFVTDAALRAKIRELIAFGRLAE
jgi:hypothetical protein